MCPVVAPLALITVTTSTMSRSVNRCTTSSRAPARRIFRICTTRSSISMGVTHHRRIPHVPTPRHAPQGTPRTRYRRCTYTRRSTRNRRDRNRRVHPFMNRSNATIAAATISVHSTACVSRSSSHSSHVHRSVWFTRAPPRSPKVPTKLHASAKARALRQKYSPACSPERTAHSRISS